MNNAKLRDDLAELLEAGHAHTTAEAALKSVKPESRSTRPSESVHSIWEELEHMRLAQEDILRYTLDAAWQSPAWPEGYWPAKVETVTDEMWNDSVDKFFSDLKEIIALIRDANIDMTSEIPHGEGRTYLREILLVADHNAYHLGQIVQLRKLIGDWPQ